MTTKTKASKAKRPALPEFGDEDRNALILAIRAGFDLASVAELNRLDPATVEAWLERGQDDQAAGDETEAAAFKEQFDNAARDAVRTLVLAANSVRDKVRNDPDAARRFLREQQAERELVRSRELTAEGRRPVR